MADNTYMKFTLGVAAVVIVGLLFAFREPIRKRIGCVPRSLVEAGDTDSDTAIKVIDPDPPESVGTVRFKESATPDCIYTRTSDYKCTIVGDHENWGVGVQYIAVYAGKFKIEQEVLSNDGTRTESEMVLTSLDSSIRKKWTGAEIRPSEELKIAIVLLEEGSKKFVEWKFGVDIPVPPGTTLQGINALNSAINIPEVKELIGKLPSGAVPSLDVDYLNGVVLNPVVMEDGKGVTSMVPKRWPKNAEGVGEDLMREHVKNFGMSALPTIDAYLYPDREVEVGDTWKVKGRNLPHMFPTEWQAFIDGDVTFQRGENKDGKQVIIIPEQKNLKLVAMPDDGRGEAELTLKGRMLYDPEVEVISNGSFDGEITGWIRRPPHHFFFQMNHAVNPTFSSTYTCEVERR